MPEQLFNYVCDNRLDLYVYRDIIVAPFTSQGGTITVRDGTRFAPSPAHPGNYSIAVYDGEDFELGDITNITGNVLTFTTTSYLSAGITYSSGSTVLILRSRGKLSAVDTNDNLQGYQQISTISYFNDLGNFVIDTNVATGTSSGYECGWSAWNILQQADEFGNTYASQLVDLVLDQKNFFMTSDPNGRPIGNQPGTNVAWQSQSTGIPMLQAFQDIILQANGGSTINPPPEYTMYVDEHNVLYFQPINITTISVKLYLNDYGYDNVGDGLFDSVIAHSTHGNDITNVINTYKLVGGTDQFGITVTALVHDQSSVDAFSQREAEVNQSTITTVDALKNYGVALLNQTAWPGATYTAEVMPSKTWITSRDYVAVLIDPAQASL